MMPVAVVNLGFMCLLLAGCQSVSAEPPKSSGVRATPPHTRVEQHRVPEQDIRELEKIRDELLRQNQELRERAAGPGD